MQKKDKWAGRWRLCLSMICATCLLHEWETILKYVLLKIVVSHYIAFIRNRIKYSTLNTRTINPSDFSVISAFTYTVAQLVLKLSPFKKRNNLGTASFRSFNSWPCWFHRSFGLRAAKTANQGYLFLQRTSLQHVWRPSIVDDFSFTF